MTGSLTGHPERTPHEPLTDPSATDRRVTTVSAVARDAQGAAVKT